MDDHSRLVNLVTRTGKTLTNIGHLMEGWTTDQEGLLCENCGKPMAEHDALAHCWPAHNEQPDEARKAARNDGDGCA